MEDQNTGPTQANRLAGCQTAAGLAGLLVILLLVVFPNVLAAPPRAHSGVETTGMVDSPASTAFTPTTYYTNIVPGVPMAMGDTDAILEFAPGASGLVTVTLVPTMPADPPVSGAVSLTWDITTTAASYEVTATFIYRRAAGPADIAIVLDRSGSMDFETVCYGCRDQSTGAVFPLPWSATSAISDADHCAGWDPGTSTFDCGSYVSSTISGYDQNNCNYRSGGGEYYTVIEAEEYSYANHGDAPYNPAIRQPFQSYWATQHNDQGSTGRDGRGYIRHHPFHVYGDVLIGSPDGNGVSCTWQDLNNPDVYGRPVCRRLWATAPAHPDPHGMIGPGPADGYPAPRADYDFVTPHSSGDQTYHFFIRVEGGEDDNPAQHMFWGIDETIEGEENGLPVGTSSGGAAGNWAWRELGTGSLGADEVHELHLWPGAAGCSVDRIVITTASSVPSDIMTADANSGRTRTACNPCDARFGGKPGGWHDGTWYHPDCPIDVTTDALYDGPQPLGMAKNGFRRFIERMDFTRDQVGYVSYSSGADTSTGDTVVWFQDLQCLRQTPGACDDDVITNTVVASLLDTDAGGGTNIAGGIKLGIDVLDVGDCSGAAPQGCARPESTHSMILLTDGKANSFDGIDRSTCRAEEDRWPGILGEVFHDAAECALYYAARAGEEGIIIHTISLGQNADYDLMQAVADLAGGEHYVAATPQQLDWVLDDLLASPTVHPLQVSVEAIYRRSTGTISWSRHPLPETEHGEGGWSITAVGVTGLSQWTLGPVSPIYYLPLVRSGE